MAGEADREGLPLTGVIRGRGLTPVPSTGTGGRKAGTVPAPAATKDVRTERWVRDGDDGGVRENLGPAARRKPPEGKSRGSTVQPGAATASIPRRRGASAV